MKKRFASLVLVALLVSAGLLILVGNGLADIASMKAAHEEAWNKTFDKASSIFSPLLTAQLDKNEVKRGESVNVSGEASEACTVGVANGCVTVDGYPIMWKVRDTSDKRQQLVFVLDSPYDYIGVRSEGGSIFMGLNEAGLASGNSWVRTPGGSTTNSAIQRHILANYNSLNQVRNYIQQEVSIDECKASGCFPFIDANGKAIIFEINRSNWWSEYDSMDPDREHQGLLGFLVRANEFHQRSDGTDDRNIGGRYNSGTYNILGLIGIDELSVRTIIQGNDYANDFEFVRYGPGRPLSTISRSSNRSVMAVHGVAPNEYPALATMWVILGQSNYGIAVPAWVRVSDIPQCLSSGDMYDRAKSLYNKRNEATTQASTFPVEVHMFDVVDNTLLPHWRAEGVPSVAEMTRIEHCMANDIYNLLNCLDNHQSDNKAPDVTFNVFTEELTASFELIANDSDGTIDNIEWNFGDNQTSTEVSPSHTYADPGTYLVSCTVTDDDGVSLTDWMYCTINNTIPPASVTNLNESEVGTTWILWSWINPPDADFHHTEVYINEMFMENVSAPEHSYRASELLPNTTYEIGTRTVDDFGNINTTWVNDTAKTLPSTQIIFDTGSGTYPSIMGNHTGTIKPNHTIIATKLYTYPCEGTGGHTEYAEIRNSTWNAIATWERYVDDWHNISFDKTVVLLANKTYNYTLRTGPYPQIHHTDNLSTLTGFITCSEFIDANGKRYNNWIPAIRLWAG